MNQQDPSNADHPEGADTLSLVEPWRCRRCDHLEDQSAVRCGSCCSLNVRVSPARTLDVTSVRSSKRSAPKRSDDELLEVAIDRLQSLFTRAQHDGEMLSDADRAQLYEALLSSLLKVERTSIKRAMLRELLTQEREALRRKYMRHLSVIWFLGICTGLALYFGLEAVARL